MAIAKNMKPLLLLPIGFGIIIGNIPSVPTVPIGVFDTIANGSSTNSVFSMIYWCVTSGLFPPLIFQGIGALTDFFITDSNPKSLLLGAAAQVGIFVTFIGALLLGFAPHQSASIG
jgi:oxaloacetate decarboxylase beta subunit